MLLLPRLNGHLRFTRGVAECRIGRIVGGSPSTRISKVPRVMSPTFDLDRHIDFGILQTPRYTEAHSQGTIDTLRVRRR